MKKSAIEAISRNNPQRNAWLAMLGPCVNVRHGARMAALATYCARLRETQPQTDKGDAKQRRAVALVNRRRFQLAKRRVAPRLVALLFDALADLDPQPLENLAAIVRRLKQHAADRQASLVTHDKVFRLAHVAWLKGNPLTRGELLRQLGVSREHDETSRERKAIKHASRFLAPDKRGRKKGTRQPRT